MVEAVRGISFTLGKERLGIVGESGSGKSMTGRAVLRLIRPPGFIEADRLEMHGEDILNATEQRMRQLRGGRVSMIMQDPKFSLNPVMTVGRQIGRGAPRARKGLQSRGTAALHRHAGRSGDPRSGTGVQPLPSRGFGRHGSTHHDCHDAVAQPGDPDRRRAHLGARRVGSAPGARYHGTGWCASAAWA